MAPRGCADSSGEPQIVGDCLIYWPFLSCVERMATITTSQYHSYDGQGYASLQGKEYFLTYRVAGMRERDRLLRSP